MNRNENVILYFSQVLDGYLFRWCYASYSFHSSSSVTTNPVEWSVYGQSFSIGIGYIGQGERCSGLQGDISRPWRWCIVLGNIINATFIDSAFIFIPNLVSIFVHICQDRIFFYWYRFYGILLDVLSLNMHP